MADVAPTLEAGERIQTTSVDGNRVPLERVLSSNSEDAGTGASPLEEAAALVALAIAKRGMGHDDEAERFMSQALQLTETGSASEDPDTAILLNDVIRLRLERGNYVGAEPVLVRLLEMKRQKGEAHPEVATVLGSLAAVSGVLGKHEAAEQMWRRALEIREQTLSPNHLSLATALEHLAKACEARGKVAEALAMLERAHSIRELTLGVEHPSVRASRDRIADLQLQMSEGYVDPALPVPPVVTSYRYTPVGRDIPNANSERLSGPGVALTPVRRPRRDEPPRPLRDEPPRMAGRYPPERPVREAIRTPFLAPEEPDVRSAALRDLLVDIDHEPDPSLQGEGLWHRTTAAADAFLGFLYRSRVFAYGIGSIAVLALVGFGIANARSTSDDLLASPLEVSTQPGRVPVRARTETTSPSTALVTGGEQLRSDGATRAATDAPTARPKEVEPAHVPRLAPTKKPEPQSIVIPSVSDAVLVRLDSLASKTAAASARPDPVLVQPAGLVGSTRRSSFDSGEQSAAPVRARLIGDLPTPHVSRQANGIEGQVVVRFTVDAQGKPVMGTFAVEESPSALLTVAVRNVIPRLRFEPARVAGPDSKPTADVVQIGFRFTKDR